MNLIGVCQQVSAGVIVVILAMVPLTKHEQSYKDNLQPPVVDLARADELADDDDSVNV